MTPAARYAAAIDILDQIVSGMAAEKVLTTWGRRNRYAGSKDRAAVRDHVYDVLRKKRSCAAWGGSNSGRGLIIGLLRQTGMALEDVFNGEKFAPDALAEDELALKEPVITQEEEFDLPNWLWPLWSDSLGSVAKEVAGVLRSRAPVSLRVNGRKGTVDEAIGLLMGDEIETVQHGDAPQCLIVKSNPRRVAASRAFQTGLVELQDAASQIAVSDWPIADGQKVLDYCAGGGGKSLAIAALHDVYMTAHDINFDRMKDIDARAGRAGADIKVVATKDLSSSDGFDVVICDAPCSGSGTWRRTPDAKWRLTKDTLSDYENLQAEVLQQAAPFVKPGGILIYATCSVLKSENRLSIDRFLTATDGWRVLKDRQILPSEDRDGFYHCVLQCQ